MCVYLCVCAQQLQGHKNQFTHDLKITAQNCQGCEWSNGNEALGTWESWDTSHNNTVFPFVFPCFTLVNLLVQMLNNKVTKRNRKEGEELYLK